MVINNLPSFDKKVNMVDLFPDDKMKLDYVDNLLGVIGEFRAHATSPAEKDFVEYLTNIRKLKDVFEAPSTWQIRKSMINELLVYFHKIQGM